MNMRSAISNSAAEVGADNTAAMGLNAGLGVTCPDCDGSGKKETCDACDNQGWVDDPDGGTMTCPDCEGRAGEDCEKCSGETMVYP